jgi:aspartyl-tRNA(Asn)/glutamyl-tRNA(Gln) amidotransferase subunit C
MPRLDDAELEHLADLARLDLSGVDRVALAGDLERILAYVDRLADADDPNLTPLRHPAHDGVPLQPADLRADVARPGLSRSDLEALTALREGRVIVPRIIDVDA